MRNKPELIIDNDPHLEQVLAIRKDREPPDDWLSRMSVGTEFLSRPINLWTGPIVDHFSVIGESNSYMMLKKNYKEVDWVDPEIFCGKNKLLEILVEGSYKDDGDHRV